VNALVIVNEPPYGSEQPYNALRLSMALAKRDDVELRVFLMGDAVGSAVAGQELPDGYYHLDRMLEALLRGGATVGCCGTCLDARAIDDERLVSGARRSSMAELAEWTAQADRLLSF
jgi:uncharacterized protein involved in oxidation of intracellular sulfur